MTYNLKRKYYVSETESSGEENSGENSEEAVLNLKGELKKIKSRERSKCYSRNAIMARENRLKKKIYMQNLENENNRLKSENRSISAKLTKQSDVIIHLEREVNYLKGILANSSDLRQLMKNINICTGMSVTSSLQNVYVSQEEKCFNSSKFVHQESVDTNFKTPLLSSATVLPDYHHSTASEDDLFKTSELTDDLSSCLEDGLFSDVIIPTKNLDSEPEESNCDALNEHNYTISNEFEERNGGICLHVSQHRVSLEFCSICNENAAQAWNKKS
ncbi:uncharacterized protein LOC108734731 isoform X1 [Agrilus planipennis]|uniref:Uncharacterized protein LOC108734731 isoform X1 n=1 Tax=Agrilus planipennis TaxID=224129 RepID=A0A1W4WD64_AGRPL|nr:uncharacterized protein LOC108734731 isoform X1 [Agrilus planipennis]XP_018321886.1 uncharacterized protein LOC108734731 isoform X1 [Agrilus planipennis]XP_018321887.1 uncharacterized protein LOC108734731 isoform X1 [Agrilus planipennis]XP_018321888.1 uncharacterized protein LOC108734731 isoform X1 [Agrilus planipennis]XP_018321889.1 uncharacterized protein LOC108734731 isoform X1 [Agrilus planipennis]